MRREGRESGKSEREGGIQRRRKRLKERQQIGKGKKRSVKKER